MQAMGLINDHVKECAVRARVERARRKKLLFAGKPFGHSGVFRADAENELGTNDPAGALSVLDKNKRKEKSMNNQISVLVATRKGAWTISGNSETQQWRIDGPQHLGSVVYHYVADPRDPLRRLMAVGGGHLGPSVFRSENAGETWSEAARPPQFPKAEGDNGRTVDHVFWLTPGHPSQAGRWYAGSSPQELFQSDDGGNTWREVEGFNHHPDFFDWRGGDKDGTPDGPKLQASFDEGENWRGLAMDLPQIYSVEVAPA